MLSTWVARFVVDHGRVTEEGGRLRTFQRRRMDEPDVDLHVICEPSGAKGEELGAQALDAIGRLFQQDKLSLTGGLQRALTGTHQTLLDWNRRSVPRDQVSIGVTAALVSDNLVYLAQAGPGLVYVLRSGVLARHDPGEEAITPLGEGDLAPAIRRFELEPGDLILAASSTLQAILDDETLEGLLNRSPDEALPELYLLTRDLPSFALLAITCHETEPEPPPGEPEGEDEEPLDRPPEYLERRPETRREQRPSRQSSAAGRPAESSGQAAAPGSESPFMPPEPPALDISRPIVRLRGEQTGPRNEYARTTGPPRRFNLNLGDWRLIQIGGAIVVLVLLIAFLPGLIQEERGERLEGVLAEAQAQFAAAQDATDPAQRRFLLEETSRLAAEALRIDELNVTANELYQRAGAQLNEMNAIFDLGPLTSLVALSNELTGEVSVAEVTVHGGRAYLLDSGGGRIVAVPLAGGPPEVVFQAGEQYGEVPAQAPAHLAWQGLDDTGRLLILDLERKLFEVRPGSTPVPVPLRRTGTWTSVAGIATFDGNLYVLDPAANQVHRYLPAANGYDSEPEVLLAAQIQLENAVDLAVDGDIYVVLSDGQVRRFQNGVDAGFSLGGIDLPIEAANDIALVPAAGEVYISDTGNKRVVVAGKDGVFRRQLVSGGFTDLGAIAVDAAASQLYVVIGDELLTAPIVR